MTVDAASVVMTTRSGERFARRVVTGCALLVVAACFGFSFGNVLALGRYLAVPEWVAWLVAPAVDLTVIGLIVGVRHLSLRGVEGRRLRPARLLLVAAGLATWALPRRCPCPCAPGRRRRPRRLGRTTSKPRRAASRWSPWASCGGPPGLPEVPRHGGRPPRRRRRGSRRCWIGPGR
jgi:hypothetical protein